jgi:epoxyqueuosine reductase
MTTFHQLYAEVASNRAWEVVHHFNVQGHEAVSTRSICLKKAAVLAGIGVQGKHTVVISPEYGTSLRFAAVITSAKLEEDASFTKDICGDCDKCVKACPTKALKPHQIDIKRCMVYASENPDSDEVSQDARNLERRLTQRPSMNNYIECTICLNACPVGKNRFHIR